MISEPVGGDEDATEHQRAEDTKEQDPVLELPRHREVAEDDRPDEDVVHGQGLLDQVAGEVLLAGLRAVGPPHHRAERGAGGHPDAGPGRSLPYADDVGRAMGEQVDGQHRPDKAEDRQPHPQGNVHDRDRLPV